MSSKPTVFIVDDDPAIRRALTVRLESMDLRAEAYGSAEEFLDACDHSQPGCILLDVRLPGISGLELLGRIVRDKLHLPVIFISAHGDVPMVVQALKGGALNFLEKPCRDQQLWEAVQEALQWDMENRKQIARSTKIQQRIGRLNDGEREVLEMVLEGKSNKVIAAQLQRSVRTIEVRRSKMMEKMKAKSLVELVRLTLMAEDFFAEPAELDRLVRSLGD